MNAHDEATYECVIRPQIATPNNVYDKWITEKSAKWQRERVVRLRRYQAKESGGGIMMDANNGWKNLEVYPFIDKHYFDNKDVNRERMYGCAGFEREAERTTLQFCWIHPFWRNDKNLKRQWPEFEERFGSFHVSFPRSNAMSAFLQAVGYVEPVD